MLNLSMTYHSHPDSFVDVFAEYPQLSELQDSNFEEFENDALVYIILLVGYFFLFCGIIIHICCTINQS